MATVYEAPENRHKVLTASGEMMPREDAKAFGYTIAPYADLIAPSERIATAHPEHGDLVCLPPFGMLVTAGTARQMGFAVSQISAAPRVSSKPDPKSAWRSSIFALNEARERPGATAELLTTRTPDTLTVEQARAFLRGLPVESDQTETTETMTTETDPRAARLAEISNSMAAYNKSMGHTAKTKDQPPALSNVEPAKLKRLSELRLAALHANGHANTQEYKKLNLALDTHNRVGTPLSRVFSQLNIDESSFLKA
jgi:hypothetical protein